MTESCIFCTNTELPQTAWILDEDIHWISAFTHDGDEDPLPAGRYTTCPTCTTWMPKARSAMLPSVVQQLIHATLTEAGLHPRTRRQMHAELAGRQRHLAALLRPVDG